MTSLYDNCILSFFFFVLRVSCVALLPLLFTHDAIVCQREAPHNRAWYNTWRHGLSVLKRLASNTSAFFFFS
jgi:hypothetical protein